MLYLEHQGERGKGWSHVFSDVDSARELEKFRCQVRASRAAMHHPTDPKDRRYLTLYGEPRMRALVLLTPDRQFNTVVERVKWELTQQNVMSRHPEPFIR